MGACETQNSELAKNRNNIIKNENLNSYKFECNMKNNLPKKSLNLEFIFSQIKIKHCISHSSTKKSIYITEVSLAQKNYELIVNKGENPVIEETIMFEINKEFTLKELGNLFFTITIYEFVDENDINIFNQMNEMEVLSEEYKSKSKYKSTFSMDLFSFLFKSKKCDFLMKGINGLSSNTRICFNCEINHRSKIKIISQSLNNLNMNKLVFKSKNINISSSKTLFDDFSIETPLITMKELAKAELFLELYYNENFYMYITLEDLKFKLLKK